MEQSVVSNQVRQNLLRLLKEWWIACLGKHSMNDAPGLLEQSLATCTRFGKAHAHRQVLMPCHLVSSLVMLIISKNAVAENPRSSSLDVCTISHHTTPHHTTPHQTRPDQTRPDQTIPDQTRPYHTIPYHTIPYHTIPYHTIPYHTIPYHTIPYHTIPFIYTRVPGQGGLNGLCRLKAKSQSGPFRGSISVRKALVTV